MISELVKLDLMTSTELLGIVRESRLFSSDKILDVIAARKDNDNRPSVTFGTSRNITDSLLTNKTTYTRYKAVATSSSVHVNRSGSRTLFLFKKV